MTYKNLSLKNSIKSKYLEKTLLKKFSKNFNKIFLDVKKDIKQINKTLSVLDNQYKFNFKTKDLNKFKRFKTIVLIGMGGSILGAEAIYNFFQEKIKKKIYFLNDLDANKIKDLKKNENFSHILFIIISKSGNTIETLSNSFALSIFKKNAKNIIIISERKNNLLFRLSKKLNLFYIEHKSHIGGRYSVLSEVGLVPAYLMGVNISRLRSRVQDCLKEKNKIFLKDSTTKLATLMRLKKIKNLIFLNYFPESEKFLFWCQQLVAESLGKKKLGFLPVVSNVPKDHHSLLQLYLDGPKDKLFNIFSFNGKSKEKISINKRVGISNLINNKYLSSVKNAQKDALTKTFLKNDIPFREFKINTKDEVTLGLLFSYFIIETIIVGKLMNINPYDQPAVEQVKVVTKQLLI